MGDVHRGREEYEDSNSLVKTQVLQEARQCFMATSERAKRLVEVLTKCITILLQGNKLEPTEATDLFFHITRLFQYKDKDNTLRRLTYIGIKALSQQAENVYVVTSSLVSDLNSHEDDTAIRASALRALCQISDTSNHKSVEHHLKHCVVDKHPNVASAAISSIIRISSTNGEVVKRYDEEIRDLLNSNYPMVQYHALGLRYNSCKDDKLAISRLINDCLQQGLKSPLAQCLLIRIMADFINNSENEDTKVYRDYIRSCLNNRVDMIGYEAANALVNLKCKDNESRDRRSAMAHLRNYLTSSRPALRFASVRSLNELAESDSRFWSVHRIGSVCKLHLLNKRHRAGDHIIGMLDFSGSNISCAKYTVILQCEETQQYGLKQEFSLGLKKTDFVITIPMALNIKASVLHCVLSFLFYIAGENYPKTLYEDRVGTIELGPNELDSKLFSCDFPIAIHTS